MIKKIVLSLSVWLMVLNGTARAQWFPHSTRARPVCCLSGRYDYSHNKLTNPVTAISFPGVTDTDLASPRGSTSKAIEIRSYSLRQKELKIDHCQISKVVVTIAETGEWTVDMLAEQNPKLLTNEQQPRIQLFHQNRFHINVRPLLGGSVTSPNALDDVAAASVTTLSVPPFWLEKGQSKQVHFSGFDPMLADRFKAIRLVQVDLQYE